MDEKRKKATQRVPCLLLVTRRTEGPRVSPDRLQTEARFLRKGKPHRTIPRARHRAIVKRAVRTGDVTRNQKPWQGKRLLGHHRPARTGPAGGQGQVQGWGRALASTQAVTAVTQPRAENSPVCLSPALAGGPGGTCSQQWGLREIVI